MHPHFLLPTPKVYSSIKCAKVGFLGENSPKFPVVHLHFGARVDISRYIIIRQACTIFEISFFYLGSLLVRGILT